MISIIDIRDIIAELNLELVAQSDSAQYLIHLESDGDTIVVKFMNVVLWNSDDNDSTDLTYIENTIIREFNKMIDEIKNYRLGD